jgi:uncharacterized repeat protein (TIGR01451 family)
MAIRDAFRRRGIAGFALAAALLGLVGSVLVAVPASAATTAVMSITKSVDKTSVTPGQTFTYTITPQCSSDNCINATVTDTIPSAFDALTLNPTVVITGAPASYSWGGTNGRTLTVQFNQSFGASGVGLEAGSAPSIQVALSVPGSLSPDWPSNGSPVVNSAQITADNADPASASATTTITVPYTAATTATATWAPPTTQYKVGEASSLTLTTRNTSNAAASSLTLTLPSDPTAANNLFEKVDLSGIGAVTLPAGADQIEVDAYVGGSWITGTSSATAVLPSGVVASTVTGLRFIFTSSSGTAITASGAAGSVVVQLAQRSATRTAGTPLVTGTVVTAVVSGGVVLGTHGSTSTSASATYTVGGLTSLVDGSTAFTAAHVPAGTTASLTVSASNASNGPLSTFVVTEDSSVFSSHVTFAGFGSGVTWPSGATSALLSWSVDSGTAPASVVLGPTDPLPSPTLTGGQRITGFSIAYTGAIAAGATAVIPLKVAIDATAVDQSAGTLTLTNTAHIDGSNDAGTAPTATRTGTMLVYFPQVKVGLIKTITPSVPVPPGGRSLVRLSATTDSDSGYVHPTTVTIVDALTADPASSQYWGAFDAVAISPTQVPLGSVLTVATTTDGTNWTDVASSDATNGAQVYSGSLTNTANLVGVRFTFVNSSGFGQGSSLQGNITFVARSTIRGSSDPTATAGSPGTFTNAATATANGDVVVNGSAVSATATQTAAAGVKSAPAAAGGVLSGKAWQPVNGSTDVNSQSGQSRTARVTWGTELVGYSTAVIQEPASPSATGAGTVFQNFNLTSIPAITPSTDPFIAFDEVTKIELFDGATWTAVGSCTPTTPCLGQMPAFTLTTAQQNSTVGVRITLAEWAAGRLADPLAPPVGFGVTSGEDSRPIDFVFQLRNKVRDVTALADPTSPWITAQKVYNGTDPGVVVNDAKVTLGGSATGTASDSINIIDNPPAVSLTKTVSNGTVVIPAAADTISPSNYPTSTFTLTATNASAARAWYLRVTDQMPCSTSSVSDCVHPTVGGVSGSTVNPYTGKTWDPTTNPFNALAITGITYNSATLATAGIDPAQSTATLWYANGTTATLALTSSTLTTASALVNVVGVSVLYVSTSVTNGGTINGTPVPLTIATRLRAQSLDPATPIAAGTATNSAFSQSWDGVLDDSNAYTSRSASYALSNAVLAVTPTKTISPSTLLEKDRANSVTVTLKAQQGATSTASPSSVVVSDTASAFWNVFQLRSIGTVTLPAGANRVQVDVQLNGSSTWTTGTPAAAAALPTGVTLSQVTGIRYTFTNTNASPSLFSTAVPANSWTATAPFTVGLRAATLDTGAAIAFPSTIVDQLDASASSASQGTATASTTANITLDPGTFSVDISKTPAVATSPAGQTVNWSLVMKNTGTGYLTDPVVTDSLPVDAGLPAGGPLLFDPTSELVYADSTGGILPVTGQRVSYDSSTRKITISWPAGSRLAPSESYTITIPIQVTPGLSAGYGPAVNTMTFSSGRTLAACTNTVSGNGQSVTRNGVSCTTQNSISTYAASAITSFKGVKGNVDGAGNSTSGAVNVNNASTPCVADSQGFYRNPCAAYTVVGGTDLWKLKVTNGGNVNATGATVVDVLPKPGDVYLQSGQSRGSSYRPVFANGVTLATDSLSAGTTMTWQVTTSANPCPSYSTDPLCSTVSWKDVSQVADLSTVTAIRATFDFSGIAGGGTLPPAATLSLTYKTINSPSLTSSDKLAPVTVPVSNARAWNSFGVFATFGSGYSNRAVEPVRAGVQLSTGPLQVTKAITGSGAAYAPTSYTATVSCTVAGAPVTLPAAGVVTLAASNATPYAARIDGIPVGAVCTVVESASGANSTGYSSPNITVAQAAASTDPVPAAQIETITNSYGTTNLVVTKRVSTTATVGSFGPFAFALACTVNNGTTTLPVPLAAGDASFSLAADASHTVTGLPVTARCNLTETDSGHANRIGVVVDGGSSTTATQGQATTIALGTHAEYDAVVTNSYDGGQLAVSKTTALSGLGDLSYYGSGPFTVAVTCTYSGQTLLDTSISINAGATTTFAPVFPAGTSCAVSETDAGGATTAAAPVSVTIPGPTVPQAVGLVTAGLTNTFATGSVRIDKAFAGAGAAKYGAGPFTAQLSCTWQKGPQTLTIPLPADGVVTLDSAHGYTATVTGLIAGASCSVAETASGGATSTAITQPTAVAAGATAVATITNRYDTDSLVISKVLAGEGAATYGSGDFTAAVSCSYLSNGASVPIDLGTDASVTFSPGHDASISNLLIGASCTVTETGVGLSVSHSSDPADGTVTIVRSGSGVDSAHVTITNQFLLGSLHIVKTASASIVQGGTSYDYTLAVDNTGHVDAAGVTVVDVLDPTLAATGITAPGWTDCAVSGADSNGFGGTLSCVLDTPLAVGAEAPDIVLAVRVAAGIAQDTIDNRADVSSTTPIVTGDHDSVSTPVKWLDVVATSICVQNAPYLNYTVDAHNVNLVGKTMSVEWLTSGGTAVHTDTRPLTANGLITGTLLWPGASVDANGNGIGWPGWRAVTPGETPQWENLILDPTLPEYGLRSGAEVRISINPTTTVAVTYPPSTPSCGDTPGDPSPDMWFTKTASAVQVNSGTTVDYVMTAGNSGLGAADQVTIVDPVPASLKVIKISPAAAKDASSPGWSSCTMTGQTASGYGGTMTCVLDRPLGAEQTAPAVTLTTMLNPRAGFGMITNTARVEAVDLSSVNLQTLALPVQEDSATILSMGGLALTGAPLQPLLLLALLLLTLGAALAVAAAFRRRRTS